LNECLTTHPESLSHDGQSLPHRFPLPTRVIDVGTESEPIAKIFQPPSVIHEQYITLSYCWGKQRFLTSVSANIAAHMKRLPESNLPQTFTDAIETTRQLGFRYLWIDALCII
jgi:Heterokaryon incompatibility protein (HET)